MNFKFHDYDGNEVWVNDSTKLEAMIRAGHILPDTLLFDPLTRLWTRAEDCPEFVAASAAVQQYAGAPSYGASGRGYELGDAQGKRMWPVILSLILLSLGLGLLALALAGGLHSPNAVAYRLGEVTGSSLLVAVVAFLIWRFLLQKKKGIGLLIFSSGFFVIAVYHSAVAAMEARSTDLATTDTVAMMTEMLNTGEISSKNFDEREYGSAAPMMKVLQRHFQQLTSDFSKMNQEMESLHLETVLQGEGLKDLSHINQGQATLQSLLAILDRYEELFRQRQEGMVNEVNASEMSDSIKREFLSGFNQSKESGLQQLGEFFNIEREFVAKADDLLNFVRSRIGHYRLAGSNIRFNSSSDAQVFNAHVQQIQLIARQEDDWHSRMRAATQQQIDKLRTQPHR
jgi:hypothetical protein